MNERMGQVNVQRQLEDIARNKTMYEHVAKDLRELEYESTWQQCLTKIKKANIEIQKSDWY